MTLYNFLITLLKWEIRPLKWVNKKIKKFYEGRAQIIPELKVDFPLSKDTKVVWFHAASYGEFEEGRPLLESIKIHYPEKKILVTFFSPSGYEAHKNYRYADWITYLPFDTKREVGEFVDLVNPEMVIFIKYELWNNLLERLRDKDIPIYLISARFIPNSRFFKFYGGFFRKMLSRFEAIYVQDGRSIKLLRSVGIQNAIWAGDPRFDRVAEIADSKWSDSIVARFKNNSPLFIAGSTCGGKDDELMVMLINKHKDIRFLIVPHELDVPSIDSLIRSIETKTKRYSECTTETDFSDTRVLILDTLGMLSRVYRYGDWAFIGGGFVGGIHSVLEASIYGLPTVFGMNYEKNRPAIDLVAIKAAKGIGSFRELDEWFTRLKNDAQLQKKTSRLALEYTRQNIGATQRMLNHIFHSDYD